MKELTNLFHLPEIQTKTAQARQFIGFSGFPFHAILERPFLEYKSGTHFG